jgi:outer membrane protein OmpA-like peptidoglycan-associated protein
MPMRAVLAVVVALHCAFVPAPALAQRWVERISPIPMSEMQIAFAAGSAELSAAAKDVLDRQAKILRAYPTDKAIVVGRADPHEAGSRQGAWDLGLARAKAARDYLISQGVAADRLRPDSRGSESVLFIHEPTAAALAGMRIVTTEVQLPPGHWAGSRD